MVVERRPGVESLVRFRWLDENPRTRTDIVIAGTGTIYTNGLSIVTSGTASGML